MQAKQIVARDFSYLCSLGTPVTTQQPHALVADLVVEELVINQIPAAEMVHYPDKHLVHISRRIS